jgi:hypothetical protein
MTILSCQPIVKDAAFCGTIRERLEFLKGCRESVRIQTHISLSISYDILVKGKLAANLLPHCILPRVKLILP